MKRSLAIVMIILAFSSPALAMALPGTLRLDRGFRERQAQAFSSRAAADRKDFSIDSSSLAGKRYIEAKGDRTDFVFGKQSYTLGNGFVAGLSGVCGLRTSYESGSGRATFFYGDNGQPIFAGDVTATPKHRNLTVVASYFKIEDPFMGVTVSEKLDKNGVFNFETTENLKTQAKGYLVSLQYGQAERRGDVYASLSYRYVEPGSVSDYSVDADLDDSKGIRLETTFKLEDNLALSLLRDFAMTQDNFAKDAASATLTWEF